MFGSVIVTENEINVQVSANEDMWPVIGIHAIARHWLTDELFVQVGFPASCQMVYDGNLTGVRQSLVAIEHAVKLAEGMERQLAGLTDFTGVVVDPAAGTVTVPGKEA